MKSYPNGRRFVEDFGDSRDFEDRVHEQILAGGGYYAQKFIDVENIPDPGCSSEVIMEEVLTKGHFCQVTHCLNCSEIRKEKKPERKFRTPLSENERRLFIKRIPLLPV
jgi:hypothetical protein